MALLSLKVFQERIIIGKHLHEVSATRLVSCRRFSKIDHGDTTLYCQIWGVQWETMERSWGFYGILGVENGESGRF